jgi:alkaline phosphatase D
MKNLFAVGIALVSLVSCTKPAERNSALTEAVSVHYDSALKPFYHGVASGDPLPDRVIIWTRVTPESTLDKIQVRWEISGSKDFGDIIKGDTISTSPAKDYTVKVDVTDLEPGQIYFYRFAALDKLSPVGRTKTAPGTSPDSLKFAVVSCANWEWGYFSAYEKISQRDDIDAVLHLGDYIYEYGTGTYGDTLIRKNIPKNEIVTLEDYRTRHSLYRTDRGLRLMSQSHPMIAIWDDHEVANDTYKEGAQNHQSDKEGDFQIRKDVAKQAYYEWIPIREGDKHYRSFSFGSLADVIMLDERLEGRTKPVDSISDPKYNSDERSMLGKEQLAWLEDQLKKSTAGWKILGNQVMYADVYMGSVYPNRPRNLDSWDGFPAEKKQLRDFIVGNKVNDIVILTGDTHSSWAIEAAIDVPKTYNAKTSKGAFAVELGTTSVSSANQDERTNVDTVKMRESKILKSNPHIKYFNARDHGYLLLTLYPEKAKAEWYYMKSLRTPDTEEYLAKKFEVAKGTVRLVGSRQ